MKIFYSASVLLIFAIPTLFLLSLEKLGLYWFIKFATIPGTRLAVDPVTAQKSWTTFAADEIVLAAGMNIMKKNIFLQFAAIIIMGLAVMVLVKSDRTWAQAQIRQSVERKFEEYRTAIKDAYKVDIKNFKDKIPGGQADGMAITNYDLKQLLEGIKSERDHTKDNLLALELAMDHLEYTADYYTHLAVMKRECSDGTGAQAQIRTSMEGKFDEYRTAIRDFYKADIKNFKDKIPGGSADGKAITNYDLKQLLEGIKAERDHTKDNLLALELAMDHLEYTPDYYTHLVVMERGCVSEKLLDR